VGFPPSTLQVERVLAALQLSSSPEHLTMAIDAIYRCFWVDGNADVGRVETFGPVLEKALGREVARRAIEESGGAEAKKRLAENTDRAFESGAFGIPWFECVNDKGEQEGFWGFDHLGQVVRFLGLKDEGAGQVAATGLVEGMKAML
jgi:2-hydroxychromene-2-carboxylate isomerase